MSTAGQGRLYTRRALPFVLAVSLLCPFRAGEAAFKSLSRYSKETGLTPLAASQHFTVFAKDEETAKLALDKLESSLQKIMADLDLQRVLNKPCLVFIWRDKEDYIKRAGQYYSGFVESTLAFYSRGEKDEPHKICLYESEDLWGKIIPHEETHLIAEVVFDPFGKYLIPPWLHEGYAEYQEEKDYLQDLLKIKIAKSREKLLSLSELFSCRRYPQDSVKLQLLYHEGEALVRYLLESQTKPGEFREFCAEFLFWKKEPGDIIKDRFGGKFPDVDTLQKGLLEWIVEKVKGVSIAPDNDFLQPNKRFSLACRSISEAKDFLEKGEKEEALTAYDSAIGKLYTLRLEDPQWCPEKVREMLDESREERMSLKKADSRLSPGSGQEEAQRKFSLRDAFSFNEGAILKIFGEPATSAGIQVKGDQTPFSYSRYSDLGMNFTYRHGWVVGVEVWEPYNEEYCGIKLEDSLEEVRRVLGSRLRKWKWKKDTYRMNISAGEVKLFFEDDKLDSIGVYKDNLGKGFRW